MPRGESAGRDDWGVGDRECAIGQDGELADEPDDDGEHGSVLIRHDLDGDKHAGDMAQRDGGRASAGAPGVPAAPTNLTATFVGSSRVSLSWIDASTNETGYRVERSSSSSFSSLRAFQLAAGAASYDDTSVAAGTTYYYRVVAYNSSGPSAPSNVISLKTSGSGYDDDD